MGHSGFIGSHLCGPLAQVFPDARFVGLSFPELDLTLPGSVQVLKKIFDRHTLVVLCSGIKRQFGDSLDIFEKNVAICLNVARALEISEVARLIFFSSMAVYGEDVHNLAIDENAPICLRSYYGLAKYTSEQVFERVFSCRQGSFLAVRPAVIYGFGDSSLTYGPNGFLKAFMDNRAVTLWGDGEEKREFLYIDDIVGIITRLAAGSQNGVVNIASGKSYSFRDVLNILSELFARNIQVVSRPRTKDKVDNAVKNDRLRKYLGSFSFTPLEEGIKKMYALEQAFARG